MSSSISMNDLAIVRSQLEKKQRESYLGLGVVPPEPHPPDAARFEEYLQSNPDYSAEDRVRYLREYLEKSQSPLGDNIASIANQGSSQILSERVHELKSIWPETKYPQLLDRICFGLVPAGGLDAFTFRAADMNAYGVVIPEGLFFLVNLFTKLVVLLQPFTPTPEGPVYSQLASIQQYQLASHPYIRFRARDLLKAYFELGEPMAALPYKSALPFQDRLAYLLAGTELFVLAHEAAHAALGHFDHSGARTFDLKAELDADSFALDIVGRYFDETANYSTARASLCGLLFLSIMRLWETAIQHALALEGIKFSSDSHPTFKKRLDNFVKRFTASESSSTPGWYLYIHNAIQIATEMISAEELLKLIDQRGSASALHVRVMPEKYAHLANANSVRPDVGSLTMADLLLSEDPGNRRLGLWFLVDFGYPAARNMYDGTVDEDERIRETYQKTICSIEPMYKSYMPRLIERFREEDREDNLEEYKLHLCSYLVAKAASKLGDEAQKQDPMLMAYRDDEPDE